jgi:hypothetical protein
MTVETDDRKRPHLRLVVNNAEKRNPRPSGSEDDFITLEEIVLRRDEFRPLFYQDMDRRTAKSYAMIERYLTTRGLPYGLDPNHGKPVVIPAVSICPEMALHEADPRDEILVFISDDAAGKGLGFTLEMILPFFSDDESLMEEALLYSPMFQYGTLFLEENRHDGYLDLIYRLGFPLYPPAPTGRLLERLFDIAAYEVGHALQELAEYPNL